MTILCLVKTKPRKVVFSREEIKPLRPYEVEDVLRAAETCMKTSEDVLRLRSIRAFFDYTD
jgi:hypothetical protein